MTFSQSITSGLFPPPIFLDSITLCRIGWPRIYRDQLISCFQSAWIKGLLLKITFIYLFCAGGALKVPTCESQMTTSRNQFSPPTMRLLRIKLRLPGLVASTFTHRGLSPAPTPCLLGHLRTSRPRDQKAGPGVGKVWLWSRRLPRLWRSRSRVRVIHKTALCSRHTDSCPWFPTAQGQTRFQLL